jgi:hypothetical protein
MRFLSYEESKKIVHKYNFKSSRDWNKGKKHLPKNIPRSPYSVYKQEWVSWGDFLGNNNISIDEKSRKFFTYKQSKEFIQTFNFKSRYEYFQYYRKVKPENIPGRPELFYEDWETWGEFLGNNNISTREINFIPIKDVLKLIKKNNINSLEEWYIFYKENNDKYNIPFNIKRTYNKSYFYFFRNMRNHPHLYLPDKTVKYLCEYYNVNTISDYKKLSKIYLRVSSNYQKHGIKFNNITILSYEAAKKFLSKIDINNFDDWLVFIKSKPKFIPRHPEKYYKEDWVSWYDFLNYDITNISSGEKKIIDYLTKHNIEFEREKRFENCIYKKKLRFDFYLPEKNICIEYNGKQHYEAIDFYGGEKFLKLSKKRDMIKENYCKQHNIKLIKIKYDQNVEKVLNIL